MRITRRTAVILAIACAAGAMLLTIVYLRSLKPTGAPATQPTSVAVAVPLKDLPAGTKITADMLENKEMSVDGIPPGTVTQKELLIGQTLADAAPAGQPIARGLLAEYAPGAGLSLSVPSGLCAVTVAVDSITGVGGFLQLGDRVDVLVTMDVGPRTFTKTVLQNILVLGVGAEATLPSPPKTAGAAGNVEAAAKPVDNSAQAAGPKPMPSVTLAVTPEQAEALVMSVKKGTIHLALRPKSDNQLLALPLASNTSVLVGEVPSEQLPPTEPGPPGSSTAPTAGAPVATAGAAGAAPMAPGAAPGAPGAAAAPPAKPGVEVFRGTNQREVVTP